MQHRLHAYAIVSDDDRIADAEGRFPDALKNDADWAYFQDGLDRTRLTLLGRLSHEASPNHRGRRRVVMSSAGRGLEPITDGHVWNPAAMPLEEMLATLLPEGGDVGVPGGQAMFDLVGAARFETFHLARAHGVTLPGGRGLFAACEGGVPAGDVLAAGGLLPDAQVWLDRDVSMVVWRRPQLRTP